MTKDQRDRTNDDQAHGAVALPTFLQPQPPREDPADPERTTIRAGAIPSPSRSPEHQRVDDGDAMARDRPPEGGSSPASTAEVPRIRPLVTAEQLAAARGIVEAMLMGATTLLNRRVRTGPADQRWLMNARTRKAIATPLARILARRSPVQPSGEQASDLADGIEAVVGLLAYAMEEMSPEQVPTLPAAVVIPAEESIPTAPAGPGATTNPFDPAAGMR